LVMQSRTLENIRVAVGHNLGVVFEGTSSASGSTTTIVDELLAGGDDEYNGKWLRITSGDHGALTLRRISDYTSSNTTLTFVPAAPGTIVGSVTYEMWDRIVNPDRIDAFINQAMDDITGRYYVDDEDLSIHSQIGIYRYDIPSNIVAIRRIDYRDSYKNLAIHDADTVWTESTDSDVTLAADDKDFKQGTASLRFTVTASASAGDILASHAITSVDISGYDTIEFWIKSTVATTAAGDLQLHLDDTASVASPLETVSVPVLVADTWTYVRATMANPELDTAIISVGLDYNVDIGAVVIWLDDIKVVKNDTADWRTMDKILWRVDREARALILQKSANMAVGYKLLRLVGYDKPALLTADSSTCEVDPTFVISRATALGFYANAGGPQSDPDQHRQMADRWMARSVDRERGFPFLQDVREVG
jgi:hypothetical protein